MLEGEDTNPHDEKDGEAPLVIGGRRWPEILALLILLFVSLSFCLGFGLIWK